MSVLIKGMDMPQWCGECRFAVDGWCYAYGKPNVEALSNDGITNWCPLVEVPKHGRFVDADKFIEKHNKLARLAYERNEMEDYGFHITAMAWVNDAPTVIEAEE